ncbi:MAG: hypothetical protein L0Y73_06730, partial [Candidatus Aminicenantes bacterium]|nr:hypothetical protein [Candidatus Aminicenantes bacterium]
FDILYLFFILLSFPLWLKFIFKKEYRRILRYRLSPQIEAGNEKRIWIHAVSVGEVKSVKSLIEQLNRQFDLQIVLSVTTPSGFRFAQKEYKNINIKIIYAPIDFSFTVKKFLKAVNPAILLLNELEIWPNWILKTEKEKIPILLINGRISENAFKRYNFFKFILERFVAKIDLFMVQADIYKEKFAQLNIPAERLVVCGNIKADTAFEAAGMLPSDREIFNYLRLDGAAENKRILTLASTHASDERALIPLINKLQEKFSLIIVPRHLNRLPELKNMLAAHKLKYTCWSEPGKNECRTGVLLFDNMGYLFNIMKISDIVFMGGTFDKKTGGHNLYEPAVLGKLIVGGPFYNNFPDIGRELVERGVFKVFSDVGRLAGFLLDSDKIDFAGIKEQAIAAVAARRGSAACILKEIQARLPRSVDCAGGEKHDFPGK